MGHTKGMLLKSRFLNLCNSPGSEAVFVKCSSWELSNVSVRLDVYLVQEERDEQVSKGMPQQDIVTRKLCLN